ncbi:uncharacterized protein LOC142240766 [Haematobia irritans]|uniref:uncharacterized protein LOC142240766 n=1 Tax=Haematobia irritans TaxID=7368 RepID=UPI003F4FCC1D
MFSQKLITFIFSILLAFLAITLLVHSGDCKPQFRIIPIDHGTINGPSGRFQRTVDMAVAPTTSPVEVADEIPVHENIDEPPRPVQRTAHFG